MGDNKKMIEKLKIDLDNEIKSKRKASILSIILSILSFLCFLNSELFALGVFLSIPNVVIWYLLYLSRGSVERIKNEIYKLETEANISQWREKYWNIKPTYGKIGLAVVGILALITISMMTSPKCPGCGKSWNGTPTMKYCFGCQAKQSQISANSGSSYHSFAIPTSCSYQNCPDNARSGSRYCSRHTCKVDGCNEKVCDPIIGYCSHHNRIRKQICAEPGCNRTVSVKKSEKYCGLHYWDREH